MPSKIADSVPNTTPVAPGLKRKHIELVVFHSRHATTIERFWRSLSHTERLAAVTSENLDEPIMAHALDSSKRYRKELLSILARDWNVRDIVEAGSDHLLQMFDRRVAGTLFKQAATIPGFESSSTLSMDSTDLAFVIVCLADEQEYKPGCKDRFLADERNMLLEDKAWYGDGRILARGIAPNAKGWHPSEHLVLRWPVARLILLRQEYIVTRLTTLMQHLVKLEAWIRTHKVPSSLWAREGRRVRPMQVFDETEGTKRTVAGLVETSGRLARATEAQLHSTMRNPYSLRCATMGSWNKQYQYLATEPPCRPEEEARISSTAFHALGLMSNELQY
ncbi:hypothetical protein MN608_10268 [Microdochium nivale]|nr:hypothetical protein MN608_10268 [Microdochium nivale]